MKPEILVKLKMRKKYKFFLVLIGLLLITTLGAGILFMSYDYLFNKESDIEVKGSISINYISGKKFKITGKDKVKFTVTNSSDNTNYYEIILSNIRGEGKYSLFNSEENKLSEGNIRSTNEEVIININIEGNKTENYEMIVESDEELSATLNIRVQDSKKESFAGTILKNNSYGNSLTKPSVEVATNDEGLVKDLDDLGVTYYFRGDVKNNYVLFDDLTWRIVRINGDGTVRLVLNNIASVLGSYYSNDNKKFEYNGSELNKYLENWYQDYIKSKDLIANTKYCSDIKYDDDYEYNAYTRIVTNNIPAFNCLGEVITSHIGTLSIDEVMFAGANTKTKNNSYYLYNKDINNLWYTMSGAKGSDTYMNMFMVNADGGINMTTNGNLYRGIRPVINLVKNIEVNGTGTVDDPYTIK